MSLFGRAVGDITSVTANSVALTPRVPMWSRVKLEIAPFLFEKILRLESLNPAWSEDAGLTRGKLLSKVVSLFHRECDVPACHMLSLMWGTGWPALYGSHSNLDEITHRRSRDLFGGTTLRYQRHVRKMVRAGRALKWDVGDSKYAKLPDDYLQFARDIETPVLFLTGGANHVFSDSNVVCHDRLQKLGCSQHQLHVFPGYGHQDVFMGKNSASDVFPRILAFLKARSGSAQAPPRAVAVLEGPHASYGTGGRAKRSSLT
jgi:cholesterol oxidase